MADQRLVKRNLKRIERVATWQLVVLFVLSLFVAATFLRINNVGMLERRQAVYDADKQGNIYDIEDRLYALQRYTAEHMNASTGDVYLDKKYTRDVEQLVEQSAKADAERSAASKAFLDKTYQTCRDRYPGYSLAFTQCVGAEQDRQVGDVQQTIEPIRFPSPSLYKFSYLSPAWSSDFAGWSILVSVLLATSVVVRVVVGLVLRILLRRQYRSL